MSMRPPKPGEPFVISARELEERLDDAAQNGETRTDLAIDDYLSDLLDSVAAGRVLTPKVRDLAHRYRDLLEAGERFRFAQEAAEEP